MDRALIPQLQAAMGIQITHKNLKWAYRELDMIPPSDLVRINDVALFCRAANQDINPLYAAIFRQSPELISATKDMLECTELRMEDVVGKSGKTVMKKLKEVTYELLYREAQPPHPAENICNPGPGPITEATNIHSDIARRYIQVRDFAVRGQPDTQICFLCQSGEKHDLVHCIARCTHFPLQDLREKIKKELDQESKDLSTIFLDLDQTTLYEILEANGYDERILQILSEAFTKLVMKSPILVKVIGHHEHRE